MQNRIDEFIEALTDEICSSATKSKRYGRPSRRRIVTSLRRILHIQFTASRIIPAQEEAPAEIEIANKLHDCTIVGMDGVDIELALEESAGECVGQARLLTNKTKLLKKLITKFEENTDQKSEIFRTSELVFEGRSKPLASSRYRPQYSYEPHNPPNDSQVHAIHNSFANSLAVIWGPPGTGKTRTIARAVEACRRRSETATIRRA